jgi:nicotinamidase-related amidase
MLLQRRPALTLVGLGFKAAGFRRRVAPRNAVESSITNCVAAVCADLRFQRGIRPFARSWGAAIVDVLKLHPEDIVVEGKRRLDACPSTNLDFILRSKGIQTVVLAGFLTNCCMD